MRKILNLVLIVFIFLFVSCNADILMNNGEITKPDSSSSKTYEAKERVFSKDAPSGVSATKSYYSDYIALRWNSVEGADYYTIEKVEKSESMAAGESDNWEAVTETVTSPLYNDYHSLSVNKYYNYRVTAHTYFGEKGKASSVAVGTILSSPETLSASKGTSESAILISWTGMPYVESYEIYKSESSSISGLKSELVASVNADDTVSTQYYSYEIDEAKEKGKELYFAIVGVGPTGEKAPISFSRSGYTLVPGAPTKPEVSVTKGEKAGSVLVHFKSSGSDSSDYKYVIKKSYPGSAEQVIFSTEFTSLSSLSMDDNGYYILEDTSVRENVEYRYSVTAENEYGISEAGDDYGYTISTVQNLSLVPDKAKCGYNISFDLPVGYDDEKREVSYTYHLTRTLKNGDVNDTEVYSEEEFKALDTFIAVDKNPVDDSREVGKIEIYVTSPGGEKSSTASSNTIESLPLPIKSITATSNNKPLSGDKANSNGVYPVHVSWETESTKEQTITRSGSDGSTATFKAKSSFDDTTTSPLVTYVYYIDTSDELGRTLGEIKKADNAYGAVTPETFISIFESVSLKPWERQTYVPDAYKSYWKQSKIATLVGYGNASDLSTQMKALDSAFDSDHQRGGRITYSAETEGVGGQIYFTYNSFGESPLFYTTGSYEMHVNSSGTGSCKSTTNGFTIYGMYPGHISLDKMSVKNKAFSGSYVLDITYSDGSVNGYEVAAK